MGLGDDDLAACQRLMQLGFEYNQCLEAYVACGKDENAAANFLFENPGFGA
jgi:UV excision repair protein RAD23